MRIDIHEAAESEIDEIVRMSRFPYGVIYEVREESIFVVAIMHLHRKPGYWNERLG